MTRRASTPLPDTVEVAREFLEAMPGMGEEVLRAGLYLWLREATMPEIRAPARIAQIAQGTGLSRERIAFAMEHLIALNWVRQLPDGRYTWKYPLFPAPEAGEKGGEVAVDEGTARTALTV